MRFIYLDESGISAKERVTVVAAIIVNADKELKAVQEHIDTIISDYVPEKYQEGFSFHAKDLFHGSGRTPFDRRHFPLDWARTALKRLLLVPGTFGLPIIYGFAEKPSVYQTFKNADPHRAAAIHHAYTYSLCVVGAEKYMRESASPSEVASLIVENNDNSQKAIKLIHYLLRCKNLDPTNSAILTDIEQMAPGCLPITKIVHGVYFAEKCDSALLQIADACAFTIRCFLEGKPQIQEFCELLTGDNLNALKRDESKDFAGYNILSYDKVD